MKSPKRSVAVKSGRPRAAAVDRLEPLLRQLEAAQEQARLLGLFPNDRDLLTCANCGLTENVLIGGGS